GFTIVELLIVIVVIAILATITVVSYTGIQARAGNVNRFTQVRQWDKLIQMYRAQHGSYPDVPDGSYCLSTSFPNDHCREYWEGRVTDMSYHANSPDNIAFLDALWTFSSSLPTVNPSPVRSALVGPWLYYWGDGYSIVQAFEGGVDDCPSPMIYTWDN